MSTLRVSTLANQGGTQSTAIENAINGSAKAWVNFNGAGTVAIRAQYNVSSITDNGVGDYTVNFTTALSDANYSVCATSNMTISTSTNSALGTIPSSYLTTSVGVINQNSNGSKIDVSANNVAIFR